LKKELADELEFVDPVLSEILEVDGQDDIYDADFKDL